MLDHIQIEIQNSDAISPVQSKYPDNLVGCFKTFDSFINNNKGFLYNLNMNLKVCEEFCQKHAYLWLKKGVECTCSETLEDLHRLDSDLCRIKCRGNNRQICGSNSDSPFSVYSNTNSLRKYSLRSDESLVSYNKTGFDTVGNLSLLRNETDPRQESIFPENKTTIGALIILGFLILLLLVFIRNRATIWSSVAGMFKGLKLQVDTLFCRSAQNTANDSRRLNF